MSFLQAVEVWVPQGDHLLRSSAAYGDHESFATRALSPLGIELAVAFPIHDGRRVRAVVVLLV